MEELYRIIEQKIKDARRRKAATAVHLRED